MIRQVFNFFAEALGARPMLMLFLALTWGAVFVFSLFQTLLHGNGILLFGWNNKQATLFMAGIVGLALLLLIWRIASAQAAVARSIASDAQSEVSKSLPVAFFPRLLAIIRISPHPILLLTGVLLLASICLKVGYELWYDAPPRSIQYWLFVNMPWTIGMLVLTMLIYNDIQVLNRLKLALKPSSLLSEAQKEHFRALFLTQLTPMELQCFQKKYLENLRNKEIAAQLGIGESTVKTHVNNMNRKWEQMLQSEGIQGSIRTIIPLSSPELP